MALAATLLALTALPGVAAGGIGSRPPEECHGCVSGRWSCTRGCDERDLRSHAFDFTYVHEVGSCYEIIPQNGSAVLFDFDVWCMHPSTRWCRTVACTDPYLGCDNMHMFRQEQFTMLEGCTGNVQAPSLVRERCDWSCKNRRPAVRCTLHFDPSDRYGLEDRARGCWLSESCEGKKVVLSATCQHKQRTEAASSAFVFVEVSGQVVLATAEPEAFLQARAIAAPACRATIAALVGGGTKPTSVRIDGLSLARRRLEDGLAQGQPGILMQYTIVAAEGGSVGDIVAALDVADPQEATSLLNAELASVGYTGGPLEIVRVSTATVAVRGAVSADGSEEEARAVAALATVVAQHLEEARAELNATSGELQAEAHGAGNAEELAVARAAHKRAVRDLLELQATHEAAQQSLEEAITASSTAQLQLEEAQASDAATQEQLAEALGELSAVRLQLSELNTSHGQLTGELAATQALHRKAQHEVSEAEAARHDTLEKLATAIDARAQAAQALSDAGKAQRELEQRLAGVLSELSVVREELWLARAVHNATRDELLRSRLSLTTALQQHEATKALLAEEQLKHKDTLQTLGEAQRSLTSERFILGIAMGSLGFLVCCLSALVLRMVLHQRKMRRVLMLRMRQGAGDTVVVGNPVDPEAVQGARQGKVSGSVLMPPSTCRVDCAAKGTEHEGWEDSTVTLPGMAFLS